MASRSWNRVELIGNLTRDPEIRYTPSGTAVATFSIATNRTFISDGEKKEEVDFHRIVAWSKLAELCSQLLKKGNRVFISGRLQNRSWEGQDGVSRQTTEIVIEDMILLTSRNSLQSPSDFPEETGVAPAPKEKPKDIVSNDSSVQETQGKQEETKKEEEKKEQKSEEKDVINDDDLPF